MKVKEKVIRRLLGENINYSIRKNGDYFYLYYKGMRVAGRTKNGRMWGATKHFKEFNKLLSSKYGVR